MRLSWKLFFITTPLFILFLTLFGTWMIHESFQSNLEKEIDRCIVENKMFENSYELVRHGLSEEQLSRASVRSIVETFHKGQSMQEGCARIYDENREVIYQDNELQVSHDIWQKLAVIQESESEIQADELLQNTDGTGGQGVQTNAESGQAEDAAEGQEIQSETGHVQESADAYNTGRQIVRQGDEYYIAVLGKSSAGVWIETLRNVTAIFEERQNMYNGYRAGMLLVSLLSGCLTILILFFVMRNTQKLSEATRQFALGRYHTRVLIKSDDEIGRLADDFNWMANVMNGQMEQLRNEVHRQEEFTAAFAHELKTPLTSIIGYADTLRSMELTREEMDMCADYIYRQGKRLQSLSYKLLEMAMAGQTKLEYREIPAGTLFREVAQTVETGLREKSITLLVSQEEGTIWGDRELLGSLLINLIDNARKASGAGGRIWLMGQKLSGGYSITVADEGKGIPPEELHRITEAFYMVDKSRSRKEGGAGLGLALCKKIIELHQGSWHMESEPGKGLRVVILLGAPDSHAGMTRRVRRERKERRERYSGTGRKK